MLDRDQIANAAGWDVYGSDGDKIGTIGQVYADDQTGAPEWVSVRTGLFGLKESFVPLAEASLNRDQITVPYTKAFVKDAPNIDEDGHLSVDQERELYAYYRRTDYDTTQNRDTTTGDRDTTTAASTGRGRTDRDDSVRDDDTVGRDTSGPTTDDAMTVSEERVNVGTEHHEVGRARLRKYVVTENVTQTVPVEREEVRLEREPITDANRDDALSGPAISEEEHEVVLHEERPVVEKEAVPVERVRLDTETVTDQETVTSDVQKERVDVDDDTPVTDRR
ncbi:MAG TPA: PRC and DUF2382 domain-containing protein [Microlunatus sp.]|nr:PRC and DUF2382 domain-containing protein [Microlunatus sp.]